MDPREYLSKSAFGGHRHYQPLRRLGQLLAGSGGLQVDKSGRNVAINQREPEQPKKAKANCCPEEVPYTLDFAWATWKEGKGVLPDPAKSRYVRKNIPDGWKVLVSTVPEPERGEFIQRPKSRPFCVRFVWVCSCEDEVVCDYEALNGDSRSLIDILRPHVSGEKCTSQLYAIEFFGFRVRNNPKPPTYLYFPRSNAYVIYRIDTKAHTG